MDEHWMTQALCRHFPQMPWIVEPEQRPRTAVAAMSAGCLACAVRSDCESFVDRKQIVSGFWAGADRTPEAHASRSGGAA